jgi:hypothetical protein
MINKKKMVIGCRLGLIVDDDGCTIVGVESVNLT